MIRSMTGFGRAVLELPSRKVSVEIRALNSKQMDLNVKIPSLYREKESDIRNVLSGQLERGKIDFFINIEDKAGSIHSLNENLALEYTTMLRQLAIKMGQKTEPDFLSMVMRLPDIMSSDSVKPDEEEWNSLVNTINAAVADLDQFRQNEGNLLSQELARRVSIITKLLAAVLPYEENRMVAKKEKLLKWISEFTNKTNFDQNRFEQEMIYYLEKMDFTEEKVRLTQHCDFFIETLNEAEGNGRKLGFIAQEMGREINTLGAKANDADIQKIVVQMKDELEKIKEQLANVL
ncbi:MAG: YicC/YloC family endoribonuclease [Bacteroidota bacterium]